VSLFDPETTARLETLQSLDDAIPFRLSRLDFPCPDCTPGLQCDDHASDAHLISRYQERHGSVFREICAGMDPDDIDRAARRGDGTPPTILAVSAAIEARLRELAADGPVVVDLGDGPVVIELDGSVLVEHPLVTRNDTGAGS
jgi:hypothetical protein